jgi:hypothetical protein
MHTKSSKQVLTPLADAVAALIVIISDSEISGAPTPNLTQLSKAVDAQIKNLVSVAERITMQPTADTALKENMPVGCQIVSKSSTLLLDSTVELVSNPTSSVGRSNLLEAVKGILQGTTQILNIFDESEL